MPRVDRIKEQGSQCNREIASVQAYAVLNGTQRSETVCVSNGRDTVFHPTPKLFFLRNAGVVRRGIPPWDAGLLPGSPRQKGGA